MQKLMVMKIIPYEVFWVVLAAGLLQRPPPAVRFGAASPPREVFLVRFGGFAAKTNQKLGFGAQPLGFASAVVLAASPPTPPKTELWGAAPMTLHQPCLHPASEFVGIDLMV
jgi:hypothetical protein